MVVEDSRHSAALTALGAQPELAIREEEEQKAVVGDDSNTGVSWASS